MGGWESLSEKTVYVGKVMIQSCEDAGKKLDVSFVLFTMIIF